VLLIDKSAEVSWDKEVDGLAGIPPKALYCQTTIREDTLVL